MQHHTGTYTPFAQRNRGVYVAPPACAQGVSQFTLACKPCTAYVIRSQLSTAYCFMPLTISLQQAGQGWRLNRRA